MLATAHDGGRESGGEFGARFERFLNGFRAAGIVVAGVDAKLVDGGSGAQNAERIEKLDAMAAFGEADGDGGAVDSRAADRDFI